MGLDFSGFHELTPPARDPLAMLGSRAYRLDGDRLLVGGHVGTRKSSIVTRQRLDGLRRTGIDHVVALTEPEQEFRHGLEPEEYRSELSRRGIGLSRFPIPDLTAPTAEQMTAILDEIDALLAAGKRVYIHCSAGLGRAGTVAACWLVRHGLAEPGNAVARLAELRSGVPDAGESPQTLPQIELVESWRRGR